MAGPDDQKGFFRLVLSVLDLGVLFGLVWGFFVCFKIKFLLYIFVCKNFNHLT